MSLKANIKYRDFHTKEVIKYLVDEKIIPNLDDCVDLEDIYQVKGRIFSYIEDPITNKYIEITIFLQVI